MMRLSEKRTNQTNAPNKKEMVSTAPTGPKIERPFTQADFDEGFFQARYVIDAEIERFFPGEMLNFKKPGWRRIHASYFGFNLDPISARIGKLMHFAGGVTEAQHRALMGVALIRYVDDFIDTALWPRLQKYDKEKLAQNFQAFLSQVLHVARQYEPSMPDEIIQLPQLELDLELNPTQENFDKKIIPLFERKAFDLSYIAAIKQGRNITDISVTGESELAYLGDCVRDFARDINLLSRDGDFNLRTFMRKHPINPSVLVTYLRDLARKFEAHQGSEVYPKRNADEDERACGNIISGLENIWKRHAIIK